MINKRIYWQVGENNEHDIPDGARVVFYYGGSSVEVWIDEEDGVIIQEVSEREETTLTYLKVINN